MLKKIESAILFSATWTLKLLVPLASILIAVMILLIMANVIGRLALKMPILGTVELVEELMVIIAFIAIPYTTLQNSHAKVTSIIDRLPIKARIIVGSISCFLAAAVFFLMSYQGFVRAIYYANNLMLSTPALEIPFFPFRLVFALGCLLIFLILLGQTINTATSKKVEGINN